MIKNPDFAISMAVSKNDRVVCIKPPVDKEISFKAVMGGYLRGLGILTRILDDNDGLFVQKETANGEPYSELRVDQAQLSEVDLSLQQLAEVCVDTLEKKGHTVSLSPYTRNTARTTDMPLFDGPLL